MRFSWLLAANFLVKEKPIAKKVFLSHQSKRFIYKYVVFPFSFLIKKTASVAFLLFFILLVHVNPKFKYKKKSMKIQKLP
jgi:hypothetical protein